jgi:hypothetical protein
VYTVREKLADNPYIFHAEETKLSPHRIEKDGEPENDKLVERQANIIKKICCFIPNRRAALIGPSRGLQEDVVYLG